MKHVLSLIFCLFSLAFSMAPDAGAVTLYADSTLKADITDGTYSVAARGPGGKDGNGYATIQAAVYTLEPGDTLLQRGGVFHEWDIALIKAGGGYRVIRGTPDKWVTIRSFPGEWAVVDAGHHEEWDEAKKQLKTVNVLFTGGAGENHAAYLRFAYFEVMGAGPALTSPDGKARSYTDVQALPGKGLAFSPCTNVVFDHLYVHDNYGGAWPLGGAGISIANESGGARHNTIQFCRMGRNGWPPGPNSGGYNVILYSDYRWGRFPDIDLNLACQNNEVSYCLLEDSAMGMKHKGTQYLCLNKEATDLRAKAQGDRIHHNVVRNCQVGLEVCQDFSQIHHNLVIGCREGISSGQPPATGYRDLFYVTMYNNTVVDSAVGLAARRGSEETVHNYPPPYHPHFSYWNNVVFDTNQSVHTEAVPVGIFPTYTLPLAIDMGTVGLDNLLLLGRASGTGGIRVATETFSTDQYLAKGWAKAMWALPVDDARPFFQGKEGAAAFDLRADLELQPAAAGRPALTPTNAGHGGDHPYLPGVKIPSYLGALNPAKDSGARWDPANPDPDDAGWAQYVLDLENLGKTIKAP